MRSITPETVTPPAKVNPTKPSDGLLHIKKMQGGTGGRGGVGKERGGKGGKGEEALVNQDARVRLDEFIGGTGGEGGSGSIGGDGGGAGKAIIEGDRDLLSKSRSPGPAMTIQNFGAEFLVDNIIVKMLKDNGYGTAGSLRFASIKDLKEIGFKPGEIGQVRDALDMWSPH